MSYLKVITGPMFSGKTEELIRLLHRSQIAGKRILVLKPQMDNRTGNEIASRKKHDLNSNEFKKSGSYPAHPVADREQAIKLIQEFQPEVLGVDEAQFFGEWMFDFVQELLKKHAGSDLMVVAAGLDMDAWAKPFGIMPLLLAIADEVQKETAVCFVCKKRPGVITQKLVASNKQVEVGDANIYESRCRACHDLPAQDQLPI